MWVWGGIGGYKVGPYQWKKQGPITPLIGEKQLHSPIDNAIYMAANHHIGAHFVGGLVGLLCCKAEAGYSAWRRSCSMDAYRVPRDLKGCWQWCDLKSMRPEGVATVFFPEANEFFFLYWWIIIVRFAFGLKSRNKKQQFPPCRYSV